MKHLVYLLIALFAATATQAQTLTKKEAKRHRKAIEESRKESSIVVSLDTVYYHGKAQFVMLYDHKRQHPYNFAIKALKTDNIFINAKDYTGSWVAFQFPTLEGRTGYVKHSMYYEKVARTVVEQGLMTAEGLNEPGVETFLANYNTTTPNAINKAIDGLFNGGSDKEEDK